LSGSTFRVHLDGEVFHVKIPLVGAHAVELALAALAVGHSKGMHVSEMLPGFTNPGIQVRLLLVEGPRGSQLIDDTYNASAPSVLSALGLLSQMRAQRKIAVLGDMRELGEVSDEQHRLVGRRAAEVADMVVTFGELAKTIASEAHAASASAGRRLEVVSFDLEQREQIVAYLTEELRGGDVVLLKGSRGLTMEEFVQALRDVRAAETGMGTDE
jgi:UDP-N-acetylmuramoyl-tripeptide--D-alanyl-D-alanine ligase